jgi:gas vesicle protein
MMSDKAKKESKVCEEQSTAHREKLKTIKERIQPGSPFWDFEI